MKVLTRDVRVLSTGLVRRAGKSVGTSEVPPALWASWIEDGTLVESKETVLVRTQKQQVKPQKTAVEKDLDKGESIEEPPLSNLSLDRLRSIAKERGIEKYWLKKKETLVEELSEG